MQGVGYGGNLKFLGNCVRGYSTGKYTSIANNSLITPTVNDDFSIGAWVNILNLPNRFYSVFSKRLDSGAGNKGYSIEIDGLDLNNAIIRFQLINTAGSIWNRVRFTNSLTIGKWYFICAVKSGLSANNYKLYLNGGPQTLTVEADTLTTSSDITNATAALINAFNATPTIFEDVYQTKTTYFNKALSADEVKMIYTYEGRLPSSLSSSCNMFLEANEKNGKTISDKSGNSVNGSLIGYTDAETATGANPQSGNTTWCDSYTLEPIT